MLQLQFAELSIFYWHFWRKKNPGQKFHAKKFWTKQMLQLQIYEIYTIFLVNRRQIVDFSLSSEHFLEDMLSFCKNSMNILRHYFRLKYVFNKIDFIFKMNFFTYTKMDLNPDLWNLPINIHYNYVNTSIACKTITIEWQSRCEPWCICVWCVCVFVAE